MSSNQRGFTIVELLIVIVVIAILAALSIVAYNGVQERAHNSSVQSDVRNLVTKVKMFSAENGELPYTNAHFSNMGIKVSKNSYDHMFNGTAYYNLVYCYQPSTAPTKFAIVAYGKGGDFKYDSDGRLGVFTLGKVGSVSACSDAGVTLDSGSDRYWFYDTNAWRTYL